MASHSVEAHLGGRLNTHFDDFTDIFTRVESLLARIKQITSEEVYCPVITVLVLIVNLTRW